jgi:formylmethanofuran dehydrogenase subunit E
VWTDDPVADFERWDAKKQKEVEALPKCDECGEHIQEECYYDIEGNVYCEECIASHKHFTCE